MKFQVRFGRKELIFDSEMAGLIVGGKEYLAGQDGCLIYDRTKGLKSDFVTLQMSTNTSTLIPALRILSLPYNRYLDQKDVIQSQNDISFYWKKSKLAAFYNRFSTDEIPFEKRETVIKRAVGFLIENSTTLPLKEEFLKRVLEPCRLLGFYQGFPIFDGATGFAKLQSRLGIHIDSESIMISTPLNKYEPDVYDLAGRIAGVTNEKFIGKKNRVRFPKSTKLLRLLGIREGKQ